MTPSNYSKKPDGKPTIAGQVEATIRQDILLGNLAPGSRINLEKLRETMKVGLTPLREAVTKLVAEGLIEVATQRGYSITPISVSNLEEVSALRTEIEPFALRHSIVNGGLEWEASVMAALYKLNKTHRNEQNQAAWEDANNAFHATLIERCDMPLLKKMYHMLVSLNGRYRHIYLKTAIMQRNVIDEHTAIATAAVERRADDATDLLRQHIERSTNNLRRLIIAELPEGQK